VLFYLDLINQNTVPAKFLKYFPQANQTSLSRSELVITFGLGVFSKSPPDADPDLSPPPIEDVQIKLSNRSAVEDLNTFLFQRERNSHRLGTSAAATHVDDSQDIWRTAHSALRTHTTSTNICPDSLLTLETSPSSSDLIIGKIFDYMHSISSPLLRQSCVVSLLSHLLTNYGSIIDIRMKFPNYPFNLYNKGIVQDGTYSQSYPYLAKGLDGTGQIIGIGDTGIDELSCFFRNADNSKVSRSSYTNPTFDLTKRKVIQYINYADSQDLGDGHGTHVAGTVAGSSVDSSYVAHNGHASGAKIAFFDMEYSSAPQYGIVYPSPIGQNVFQVAYNAGARLHSNSWGNVYNFYDSEVLSIDNFHVTRVDFLALFAAGNSGDEGYYSVGYPSVSKNAMAIGASMSDSTSDISKVAYFSGLGPTFDNRIKPDVVAPGYFTTSARASSSTTSATCSVLNMAGTSMATPLVCFFFSLLYVLLTSSSHRSQG
jgi:subtilisin family serine protease